MWCCPGRCTPSAPRIALTPASGYLTPTLTLAAGTVVDMDDVFDLGTREMNGRVPKVHGLSSILGGLWELQ